MPTATSPDMFATERAQEVVQECTRADRIKDESFEEAPSKALRRASVTYRAHLTRRMGLDGVSTALEVYESCADVLWSRCARRRHHHQPYGRVARRKLGRCKQRRGHAQHARRASEHELHAPSCACRRTRPRRHVAAAAATHAACFFAELSAQHCRRGVEHLHAVWRAATCRGGSRVRPGPPV